jgi:hypothetical protein
MQIDLNNDAFLSYLFEKIGFCMLSDLDEEELTDFLTELYNNFIITKKTN